jgi:hypothetical protein
LADSRHQTYNNDDFRSLLFKKTLSRMNIKNVFKDQNQSSAMPNNMKK